MNFLHELKTTFILTLVLLFLCCGLYPLAVTVAAQVFFPYQATGSLVLDKAGKPIASTLIGQNFTGNQYFQPRPSAAGTGYDASASSGTNLGPTSQSLHDAVKQRVSDYRLANGLPATQAVPADAVTSSASGLDPQISVKNALLQLPRVARNRHLPENDLKKLIRQCTDGPDFGLFGDAGVNVVKLNLTLDGRYQN